MSGRDGRVRECRQRRERRGRVGESDKVAPGDARKRAAPRTTQLRHEFGLVLERFGVREGRRVRRVRRGDERGITQQRRADEVAGREHVLERGEGAGGHRIRGAQALERAGRERC